MESQEESNQKYKDLALNSKDLTETAGRLPGMEGSEEAIFNDVISKLNLSKGDSLIDIGCGFGHFTKRLLDYSKENQIDLTLVDIPEVIQRIKKDLNNGLNFKTYEGNFPHSLTKKIPNELKFSKVLCYSVLHCVDNPFEFVSELVNLLAPGGELLLGDCQNMNMKGRFVSSDFGREFDAQFKNVPVENLPIFKDQFDFITKTKSLNWFLGDHFFLDIFKKYRGLNYEVYVLPQNKNLPFSFTREDYLIKKRFN